jgi:hypothetical protein
MKPSMDELIITYVTTYETDDGIIYPSTKIFRFDFDGNINKIIQLIEDQTEIVGGGPMVEL